MFYDEFLKIEPNNKQLSSRVYQIRTLADSHDLSLLLEQELIDSLDILTNLSKKFDKRKMAFETIKSFKTANNLNSVFFSFVLLNVFYEELITKKNLINYKNPLSVLPSFNTENITIDECCLVIHIVDELKKFFFDKAVLFLKNQPIIEDKIRLNLLNDSERITNNEIENLFNQFLQISYSIFNFKKELLNFFSLTDKSIKEEDILSIEDSHKHFIFDCYDTCMKYLFPLYDYKGWEGPQETFFLKKFISSSINQDNWEKIKEILMFLVNQYKFFDASVLLAMIFQLKPYFTLNDRDNIKQAIDLYISSFNEGDEFIFINNKKVYFRGRITCYLPNLALQITKLYYEKKDIKNAQKWIREAKHDIEIISDVVSVQKKLYFFKHRRDTLDSLERQDLRVYGEACFYYAILQDLTLFEKLKNLWLAFNLLNEENDIVIVEILKLYNEFLDKILAQKFYVHNELMDQFKNRLKFYLETKNELQFEIDFKLPKIKTKVCEYFDIEISKKKQNYSSSLLGEEGENLEYKTSAYHPYPKFPDKTNFKGTDLYVIGNKRFKNKNDVHQFIVNQFLKTINGFLNANGGTLLIGVNEKDNLKNVVGIEYDLSQTSKFSSSDKYVQFIQQTIENHLLPEEVVNNIKVSLIKHGEKNLCEIKVRKLNKQRKPALIKVENADIRIYQRRGNRTAEIPYAEQHRYF